jgi:hypothetical protein
MKAGKLIAVGFALLLIFSFIVSLPLRSQQNNGGHNSQASGSNSSGATDPGVRAGSVNAGLPLSSLSTNQLAFFQDGQTRFQQVDQVASGLGPSFNSNSCSSCHAQPAVGGTSPATVQYPNIGPNPQIEAGTANGATNSIPFFITADGPVREARFPFVVNSNGSLSQTLDGGVRALFTIAGRQDAGGCAMAQPNFEQMQQLSNLIFRIPTPLFGAGLIENFADGTILANMQANASLKQQLGISGHPNYSANDGPSLGLAGRRRTNHSKSLLERPTTSKSA